jgi:bifunctional DNA-binding transcriptional regulator/antitoxin component of YhaV-PrlF toxin-antitoxin module
LNSIKIIGLPVVVSARSRIVLDRNIRSLYGIDRDDTVIMHMEQGFLFISPVSSAAVGEQKNISIGRFNLPQDWVKQNNIQLGDFVYLIATDNGIAVCPKNLELICVGRLEK